MSLQLRPLEVNATLVHVTGVDVQGNAMPSKLEIFKIIMKPNVRDAVMKVSAAFQEAGINPKVRYHPLSTLLPEARRNA